MSFNNTLAQKDPITGETYQEYLQRNGMTIPEAQTCFMKIASIQNGHVINHSPSIPLLDAVTLPDYLEGAKILSFWKP